MKTMRSEVCKKANALIKNGYTRSAAFVKAWAEVKKAANSIKTADLVDGMVVRIDYGYVGNTSTVTITEVSKTLFCGKYFIVRGISSKGNKVEFCSEPESLLEKVA